MKDLKWEEIYGLYAKLEEMRGTDKMGRIGLDAIIRQATSLRAWEIDGRWQQHHSDEHKDVIIKKLKGCISRQELVSEIRESRLKNGEMLF